jgi:hypothetical protein
MPDLNAEIGGRRGSSVEVAVHPTQDPTDTSNAILTVKRPRRSCSCPGASTRFAARILNIFEPNTS